jgi:hypothetical protein
VARIRYIKPDTFADTDLAEVSIPARLLYIGLWCYMDCDGVAEADSKLIKRNLFPYDDAITSKKIHLLIDELIEHGFLFHFKYNDREYLFCPTLAKHQKFHKNETSKYLIPSSTLQALSQTSAAPYKHPASSTGNGELATETENGELRTGAPALPDLTPTLFLEIWREQVPPLPDIRELSPDRKKKAKARLVEKPDPDYWREVFARITKSKFLLGEKGWKADFDWILQPDSHIRVMEGKYDDRNQTSEKSTLEILNEFEEKNAKTNVLSAIR